MSRFGTFPAKAQLERELPVDDPRRAALSALPDEMESEAFDASFDLLLRLLRQKPATEGPS